MMKMSNHLLNNFLLLSALAIFVLLFDIRSPAEYHRQKNLTFFKILPLAGPLYNAAGDAFKIDSPCDMPPRLALLAFQPFDLNRADAETLSFISGIGEKLGQRIIDAREKKGHFSNIDELLEINGIGPAKLAAIEEHALVCL